MNEKHHYAGRRNSFMELYTVYFWTGTIHDWCHLLAKDECKQEIIRSLQWLHHKELIAIYGFVIMPNHVHLLWEQLAMNGREYPKNSFDKFTAHKFLHYLRKNNPSFLEKFRSPENDRNHLFWQYDPLAIEIICREMVMQKLEYIHFNPLQEHWNLSNDPVLYRFSSACFYETGEDEFGFLTHFADRF